MVPGGLRMRDDNYGENQLEEDIKTLNGKLSILTGHKMRPYKNFGQYQNDLVWFTLLRNPQKRFVSHYLHDKAWTNNFAYSGYKDMQEKTIIEWEGIENYSNYQTKFLAGEENLDKAIEILENKMSWVGITEDFKEGIKSLKYFLDLKNLVPDEKRKKVNRNLLADEEKNKLLEKYEDFIREKNNLDNELYDYVKNNIWPQYKLSDNKSYGQKPIYKLRRYINLIHWQIVRQTKFRTSELNLANLKRFY